MKPRCQALHTQIMQSARSSVGLRTQLTASIAPPFQHDPGGAKLLHAIAGNSPFLAQCLQRDAAFACRLLKDGPDKAFANILANLRGTIDAETDTGKFMSALRESKRNAALTIAVGDISDVWDVNAVMGALSTYADESIAVATRHVLRQHAKAGEARCS